jgi:two-component system sensor histidine kinase VicK
MSYLIDQSTGLPNIKNVNFVFGLESSKFLYLEEGVRSLIAFPYEPGIHELFSLVHEEDVDMIKSAYSALLKGSSLGVVKFRIISNSETIWLAVMPFADLNHIEPVIFGNIENISSEIENFSSISRYANKKNSVLHMLAHDLRGPLGLANSLITVLEKDIDQPKNLNMTKAISNIIQEAIDLIGDLIDREFLETIGVALLKKRIDIVKKLSEYIDECKRSAHLANRNFNLVSSRKMIQIEIDEAKFMQVMNNLLSNALKFTHSNGTITINVIDQTKYVDIIFSDDGIGIPENLLPTIFDSFTGSKREGLHGEPTTGLGLSIVKDVISWHDGTISCESKEGSGTTFNIRIPKDAEAELRGS